MNNKNIRILNECLLNNIIDKDFQAVLYPLNLFQSFFLMSQFGIKNNFITPKNNMFYRILSMVGLSIIILIHYSRFFFYYSKFDGMRTQVMICLLYTDLVISSVISSMTYTMNIMRCEDTVELIIRLQKVLNSINVDRNFFFKLKIENWTFSVLVVLLYVSFCSWFGAEVGIYFGTVNFFLTIPMLIYDLHVINVSRAIVFITHVLVSWSRVMKDSNVNVKMEDRDNKVTYTVMFDAYVDILKAFRLCNKVYQFSVTYFVIHTFVHVLYNVETIIQFRHSDDDGFLQSSNMKMIAASWNVKNFCLLIALSVACENFYRTVKMVESLCAQIAKDHASGLHRTCKNVCRVNRASLRKLSAYGLFEIDAAFPARVLACVVAYTVVLLQFAFL